MKEKGVQDLISRGLFDRLVSLRRGFHQYPELSWEETKTAAKVAEVLTALGIPCRRDIAGTGVLADIPGPAGVPVIALRADMDALPIIEETGLEFASTHVGCMHACGHDGHTAMLLGAAELLAHGPALAAPVRLIFQPAEERGAGAAAMVAAGALDQVGMVFGAHLDRHYQVGAVVVGDGVMNASTDTFRVRITGQGGHAARPHETVDAVVVGSLMVMAIQTIVSREVNPAKPSVVTVGRFDAGTAANVIAGQALLEGTIRAQDPEVRCHLKEAVERITSAVGRLHGAVVELEFSEGTPPVINEPACAALARAAAAEVLGAGNVLSMTTANMGGEDFSYYLEKVPGCYVRLGARFEGRPNYPAHSSKFDFDERALAVGAVYFNGVARAAGRRFNNSLRQTNHDQCT
jgi:hippurate hydrolase